MGGEEKLSLRWNDFENCLSSSFQQFRGDLVDVEIFCGSSVVLAHRLVLCACSQVLRDMILRCSKGRGSPALLLLDVDTRELGLSAGLHVHWGGQRPAGATAAVSAARRATAGGRTHSEQ